MCVCIVNVWRFDFLGFDESQLLGVPTQVVWRVGENLEVSGSVKFVRAFVASIFLSLKSGSVKY